MSQLPTLNQFLGGGAYPQSIPANNPVPESNVPKQDWNQPPQQGNYNQPPQQPQPYPDFNQQQPGYGQQANWNQNQGGYPQQPNYAQPQSYNNFSNEIYSLRSQYGMQIPDDQIDQTLDAAKANRRMYLFPGNEKNFVRYDEKGKSFISSAHSFHWAHKENKEFWCDRNEPNSYDGTASYLNKVCWIGLVFSFNHVRPGNYQLFVNTGFDNPQMRDQLKMKVCVGDRQVFSADRFPNAETVKNRGLTEIYICDIKSTDFDMFKLDNNGDAVVKVEFNSVNNSWKKGWIIDGGRLLSLN